MRKVMTILGTRPELIKMSLVIERLDQVTQHVLVHTGQNHDYTLNKVFFDELRIRQPDHFLAVAGSGPIDTISRVLTAADAVLEQERPEAVLIYGDTNSGLAVIAAKRRRIPVFHMEAGNRSFDQRVPEELNRKIIDHLSDVNMTLTEHARRYLLAEGLPPDRVFKVGSHMEQVLQRYRSQIEASDIHKRLGLQADRYFVVSLHREENVDTPDRLRHGLDCLERVAESFGWPVIVSTHPRTRKRLADLGTASSPLIRFLPPFGFPDYIHLQSHAHCVLSDSGTITEEAALLGFPAVMLRDAHERPEGMDAGVLVMSSLLPDRVMEAIACVRSGLPERAAGHVPDYEAGDVAGKVVRIVLSYIDHINHAVWRS